MFGQRHYLYSIDYETNDKHNAWIVKVKRNTIPQAMNELVPRELRSWNREWNDYNVTYARQGELFFVPMCVNKQMLLKGPWNGYYGDYDSINGMSDKYFKKIVAEILMSGFVMAQTNQSLHGMSAHTATNVRYLYDSNIEKRCFVVSGTVKHTQHRWLTLKPISEEHRKNGAWYAVYVSPFKGFSISLRNGRVNKD
jgi:hypothetical protein